MPFSSRTMRAADWRTIKHFLPSEFKSPTKMGYEFVQWLDAVREDAGVPMVITSSYRSPAYNKRIGGATNSAHTLVPCNAVDIGERPRKTDPNWNYSRYRILTAALEHGCARVGMYADGSFHFDRAEDTLPAPRIWRVVR